MKDKLQMKYTKSDNISVTLTDKGREVLKIKNLVFQDIPNTSKTWFKIWELQMYFGKKTINLMNSCPIVENKFFGY